MFLVPFGIFWPHLFCPRNSEDVSIRYKIKITYYSHHLGISSALSALLENINPRKYDQQPKSDQLSLGRVLLTTDLSGGTCPLAVYTSAIVGSQLMLVPTPASKSSEDIGFRLHFNCDPATRFVFESVLRSFIVQSHSETCFLAGPNLYSPIFFVKARIVLCQPCGTRVVFI